MLAMLATMLAGTVMAHAEPGEDSFATISSPFAITGPASNVTVSSAVLSGGVYPGGAKTGVYETKYLFEYGTTTSYGSYSSEGNAGSELVGKAVTTEIDPLAAGISYHYRIVASNSQGTYYGSDSTFTTKASGENSSSAAWSARNIFSQAQWLFSSNASEGLWETEWTGSEWSPAQLGGSVASGTVPSATTNTATGQRWVFYTTKSDEVGQWFWNGSSWEDGVIAGSSVAAGTSPVVVQGATTKAIWVYYIHSGTHDVTQLFWNSSTGKWESGEIAAKVGSGGLATIAGVSPGEIWVYYVGEPKAGDYQARGLHFSGSEWVQLITKEGVEAEPGSTPTVAGEPTHGGQWVFYVARSTGKIVQWYRGGAEGATWENGTVETSASTPEAELASSPAAIYNPGAQTIAVFFAKKTSDALAAVSIASGHSEWSETTIGGHVQVATPIAVHQNIEDGQEWVYYVDASSSYAEQAFWGGSSWTLGTPGDHAQAKSSVSMLREAGGSHGIWSYYIDGSSQDVAQWHWSGSNWKDELLGGVAAAAETSPSAVRNSSGSRWIYYTTKSDEVAQWYWGTSSWENGVLPGSSVAAGTSPTVVPGASSSAIWIYYVHSSTKNVAQLFWNNGASKWEAGEIANTKVAVGSNIAVIAGEKAGEIWLYYIGEPKTGDYQVRGLHFNGTEWAQIITKEGTEAQPGSTPTVIGEPTHGGQWVYYLARTTGKIVQWYHGGTEGAAWENGTIETGASTPEAELTSSPAAIRNSHTEAIHIYYANKTTGALAQVAIAPGESKWSETQIGGMIAPDTTPAVAQEPETSQQWVQYADAGTGAVVQWYFGSSWTSQAL
jgi:hypothetical protein